MNPPTKERFKPMHDTTSRLTKREAELLIRDRAASYVDEHGADHTLPGFPFWLERLSQDAGAPLDPDWAADVLFYMEAVTAAENGTHPAIRRNAAQTIDTTQAVLDYESDLLTKSLEFLLSSAGFPGSLSARKAA
jgi:hypothetical protein